MGQQSFDTHEFRKWQFNFFTSFRKVDRTTYKATMVVDENAVISYVLLFYKTRVIEFYRLNAD